MDIILSNGYLALIYNYYIMRDYVAIYQCTDASRPVEMCVSTCKYK